MTKEATMKTPTTRQYHILRAALVRAGDEVVAGAHASGWLYRTHGVVDIRGWGEFSRREVTGLIRDARRAAIRAARGE